jgi:hypothetical protein
VPTERLLAARDVTIRLESAGERRNDISRPNSASSFATCLVAVLYSLPGSGSGDGGVEELLSHLLEVLWSILWEAGGGQPGLLGVCVELVGLGGCLLFRPRPIKDFPFPPKLNRPTWPW